jgi:hypothetical protein
MQMKKEKENIKLETLNVLFRFVLRQSKYVMFS